MAGQQQPGGGSPEGEGATDKATDKAIERARRRAERQRRAEDRRRRWSRSDAAPQEASAGTPETTPVPDRTSAALADEAPVGTAKSPETPEVSETSQAAPTGDTAVLTKVDDPPASSDDPDPSPEAPGTPDDGAPRSSEPVVPAGGPRVLWRLLLAAHPRQAVATAAVFAALAALAGRPPEQVGLLGAMVLVGQSMLGWHNDLVDRDRDAASIAAARAGADTGRRTSKPLADGRLEAGTVWYALAVALLVLAPLSVANGLLAALTYAVALVIGMLGNLLFRRGWLSWLPWAASYALYPVVLAYAGAPGSTAGPPPQPALVVLAALLGVAVHVLRALPGLVQDNRDGSRHLPLRIALRTGAPRLLGLASVLAVVLVIAILTVGAQVGLVR